MPLSLWLWLWPKPLSLLPPLLRLSPKKHLKHRSLLLRSRQSLLHVLLRVADPMPVVRVKVKGKTSPKTTRRANRLSRARPSWHGLSLTKMHPPRALSRFCRTKIWPCVSKKPNVRKNYAKPKMP